MFHIPQSRKFIIGVTVHLESFDGRYNETLVFYPLKVSNDAFDSSSMRGFWAVGESVILVHRIGNFGPSSFFLSFFLWVWPPRFQSLLIMVWCYSKPEHRL